MAKLKKCTGSKQKKFERCEKRVIKTVKPRGNQSKVGAAVAICRASLKCK